PSECLKIIESKSKVRQSRAKAVVAKVNSSSSNPAISFDVAELKDMVRALLLDKKNQSSAPAPSHTPALVKAVEPNCVTCGGSVTLPSNTITNPKEDLKGITFRSGVAYQRPTIPTSSKVVKQGTEVTKDQMQTPSSQSTAPVQPPVAQSESSVSEPVVAPFASTFKTLNGNKEKLSEMARTLMNEHCSAIILNKLPKKLRDPGKFLIPYEFPGMDECLALADLGASINLMPLFVWEELLLPELTPTCITLELADRSVSKPIGIAKDVKVKVGMFHFPSDFMVVDFEPDPRVPLILGRCFLKIGRALIDVHKDELTLCIGNEDITYNLDQTSRYSSNYDQITANKVNVTNEACEEYSQEVLGFSDVTTSGSPTPSDDPIVSTTSPTLTPFGDTILNSDPSPLLPNHEQSMPSFKNELKACEAKTIKFSVDEPPKVELKDLPPHLEYAFLECENKLLVIIAKELGDEEKSTLIKVLKSHKRAITWKLSDIQEVKKILEARLIYSISDSPWVSPVHCVPKKGGFTVVKNEENELILTRLVTGWRVYVGYLYDMVEKMMEVFMDDFSVFGNSFKNCLSRLDKMLQRCEDTKLCLNWEKSHFMVKEGIVLGHKISKNGIEVDKAKVN
nr:reverse transcriptase domain-containing protein [Tanacetum cinerariifolium]